MSRNVLLLLALIAALVGCGGGDVPTTDGGMADGGGADSGPTPDTGAPDAPSARTVCATERAITLTVGTNTVTGDTTGASNDLELGAECGDPEATRAAQEAVALTLPGTGQVGVRFTMATAGTAEDFDTIVQLRRGGCSDLASAEGCAEWDDIDYAGGLYRSAGAFLATGGDTVHLIVSGYTTENVGPWEMEVEVVTGLTAPTETSATVQRVDGARFDFTAVGGDAQGDAAGIRVTFLDSAGADIGLDTDDDPATPDQTEFEFGFDEPVTGMTTFTAHTRVGGIDTFPELVTAPQARVAIVDDFGLVSDPMTVSITDVMESGRGESCATGFVCADGFECVAMVCEIPPAIVTYCASATPIAITPGTATTTASVTGTVAATAGMLTGSCGNTNGDEELYSVTVPAAVAPITGYDLIATTDTAATADGDTILYVLGTCGDAATEGGCSDDITAMTNVASSVTVMNAATGTHTIAVEGYGVLAAALPFGLDVSLRPVLATGEICDPTGAMNRCAGGACPATTPLCP